MFDDKEKESKKTELQIDFFKKCYEEGFTFSEMLDFDNYNYALMYCADELSASSNRTN